MNRHRLVTIGALGVIAAGGLALAACVSAPRPEQTRAPEPTKPVDAERLWSGRWLEVARLPMKITDDCVAGASIYDLTAPDRVGVRDTCQIGTPQGREKAISGSGRILDPGFNTKLRVRYLFGLVTWDFWVLDRADDYSWFISADPTMDRLFIYTREVPSEAQVRDLTQRAAATGYDVSRLEFPAQP